MFQIVLKQKLIGLKKNVIIHWSACLTLLKMWGKVGVKKLPLPTSFSSVTSTINTTNPKNVLTFSLNSFATLM